MLRCLLVLGAVAAAAGTCADLKTAFNAHIAKSKVGGILRIQQKGKSAYSLVGGQLSNENTLPFSENTPFEIASVTKTFVSALILAKIQQGATTLDSTAKSILQADLPASLLEVGGADKTNDITLRQLLTHTSGLTNYWQSGPTKSIEFWYSNLSLTAPTSHPWWATWKGTEYGRMTFQGIVRPFLEKSATLKDKIWTPAETLAIAAELDSGMPGTFIYTDTGYVILGLVAEKLWGTTLESAVLDNMLKPLGITPVDTWMRYDVKAGTDKVMAKGKVAALAHRYSTTPELGQLDMTYSAGSTLSANEVVSSFFYSADWGGGGMISTAADLGNFWMTLLNSQVEPWKTVASQMKGSMSSNVTYGLGVVSRANGAVVGHTGDGGASMQYEVNENIVISGTDNNSTFTGFVDTNLQLIRVCAAAQETSAVTTISTPTTTPRPSSANVSTPTTTPRPSSANQQKYPMHSAVMWIAASVSVYLSLSQRRML